MVNTATTTNTNTATTATSTTNSNTGTGNIMASSSTNPNPPLTDEESALAAMLHATNKTAYTAQLQRLIALLQTDENRLVSGESNNNHHDHEDGGSVALMLGGRTRSDIYAELLNELLKIEDSVELVTALRAELVPLIDVCLMDVRETDVGCMQPALRVIGYFMHHVGLVSNIPAGHVHEIVSKVLHLLLASGNKVTCSLCAWLLAVQNVPKAVIQVDAPRIVQTLQHTVRNSQFHSGSLEHETALAAGKLASQLQHDLAPIAVAWCQLMLPILLSDTQRAREKADEVMRSALPFLTPPTEALSLQIYALADASYLQQLSAALSNPTMATAAMRAWGYLVHLLGSFIFKGTILNTLLKLPEAAFQTPSAALRLVSLEAWTHLINNFASRTTPISSKRVHLLVAPMLAILQKDTSATVREQAVHTWGVLLQSIHSVLTSAQHEAVESVLQQGANDADPAVRTAVANAALRAVRQSPAIVSPYLRFICDIVPSNEFIVAMIDTFLVCKQPAAQKALFKGLAECTSMVACDSLLTIAKSATPAVQVAMLSTLLMQTGSMAEPITRAHTAVATTLLDWLLVDETQLGHVFRLMPSVADCSLPEPSLLRIWSHAARQLQRIVTEKGVFTDNAQAPTPDVNGIVSVLTAPFTALSVKDPSPYVGIIMDSIHNIHSGNSAGLGTMASTTVASAATASTTTSTAAGGIAGSVGNSSSSSTTAAVASSSTSTTATTSTTTTAAAAAAVTASGGTGTGTGSAAVLSTSLLVAAMNAEKGVVTDVFVSAWAALATSCLRATAMRDVHHAFMDRLVSDLLTSLRLDTLRRNAHLTGMLMQCVAGMMVAIPEENASLARLLSILCDVYRINAAASNSSAQAAYPPLLAESISAVMHLLRTMPVCYATLERLVPSLSAQLPPASLLEAVFNAVKRVVPADVLANAAQTSLTMSAAAPTIHDLLHVLAPLLGAVLIASSSSLANRCLAFWEDVFGKASKLLYPPSLLAILRSLRKRAPISLPGIADDSPLGSLDTNTNDTTSGLTLGSHAPHDLHHHPHQHPHPQQQQQLQQQHHHYHNQQQQSSHAHFSHSHLASQSTSRALTPTGSGLGSNSSVVVMHSLTSTPILPFEPPAAPRMFGSLINVSPTMINNVAAAVGVGVSPSRHTGTPGGSHAVSTSSASAALTPTATAVAGQSAATSHMVTPTAHTTSASAFTSTALATTASSTSASTSTTPMSTKRRLHYEKAWDDSNSQSQDYVPIVTPSKGRQPLTEQQRESRKRRAVLGTYSTLDGTPSLDNYDSNVAISDSQQEALHSQQDSLQMPPPPPLATLRAHNLSAAAAAGRSSLVSSPSGIGATGAMGATPGMSAVTTTSPAMGLSVMSTTSPTATTPAMIASSGSTGSSTSSASSGSGGFSASSSPSPRPRRVRFSSEDGGMHSTSSVLSTPQSAPPAAPQASSSNGSNGGSNSANNTSMAEQFAVAATQLLSTPGKLNNLSLGDLLETQHKIAALTGMIADELRQRMSSNSNSGSNNNNNSNSNSNSKPS